MQVKLYHQKKEEKVFAILNTFCNGNVCEKNEIFKTPNGKKSNDCQSNTQCRFPLS